MVAQLNDYVFLAAVATVAIVAIKISLMLRGREMRALASRWGLRYVGPPGPRFVFGYMPKIKPDLPFSRAGYPTDEIRQVWNVIEGELSGVRIVLFDSLLYSFPAINQFCTFMACQTDQDPFGSDGAANHFFQIDQVMHKRSGWTLLYRMALVHTLMPWSISINRLERALSDLARVSNMSQGAEHQFRM
jgi:hypothetical protein